MTAQEVYQEIVKQGIVGAKGHIKFSLGRKEVLVSQRDSVGNLLQSWFNSWLSDYFPNAKMNPKAQEFPDFFLNPTNLQEDLLEVKTFDLDRGPGFDIANFDSYCNSLLSKSYRLNSDYLVFGYRMTDTTIRIEEVWLKKVWEIAGSSGTYPLKVQEKKNVIYNIRPVIWYSDRSTFKPFCTRRDFIDAINETRYQYPKTHHNNAHWLREVKENYLMYYRQEL